MRDVSAKVMSLREATASARLHVSPETLHAIRTGNTPKGDPFPVARVAAIQAAKNTPQIVPYCHPVPVDCVTVTFAMGEQHIDVEVFVKAVYKTGVEMEALTAASAAALTLFDLLKPIDLKMEIDHLKVLEKAGGKSQFVQRDSFAFSVVVVSDSVSSGQGNDRSGALLQEEIEKLGGTLFRKIVTSDDIEPIQDALRQAISSDAERSDLVFLTGGTGLGPRDVTPQAVLPLLDVRLRGIEHRLHQYGQDRLPTAMLGRPFAGVINQTIVIGIPGSPAAAQDALSALFPYIRHAFHIVRGGDHAR